MVVQTRSQTKALLKRNIETASKKMFKLFNFNIRSMIPITIRKMNLIQSIHLFARSFVQSFVRLSIYLSHPWTFHRQSIKDDFHLGAFIYVFQLLFYILRVIVFACILYRLLAEEEGAFQFHRVVILFIDIFSFKLLTFWWNSFASACYDSLVFVHFVPHFKMWNKLTECESLQQQR